MKWMGLSLGIVAAAALVAGLVWAADLNGSSSAQASAPTVDVEDIIAQKSGLSKDTIHKVEAAALGVAADKVSAAGLITSAQASKLRNLSVGPILDSLLDSAAQSAHVSDQDLVDGLSSGKSLAQIASGQGVSRDDLKKNLSAAVQAQLTIQQNAGLIDASESTMITTAFNSYLDKIVDFSPPTHK